MSVGKPRPRKKAFFIVFCIVSFLLASFVAAVTTASGYVFYHEAFDVARFRQQLSMVWFAVCVGYISALPGMAVFQIWGLLKLREELPRFVTYTGVGFLIALVNGAAFPFVLHWGRMDNSMVVFFALFFGATGALAAAIHWRIMRFSTSRAVTLLAESAKKELYSQF